MRCRYLGVLLIVAVALFAGYTVYSSNQTETKFTDLSLMNIEAMALDDEVDEECNDCYILPSICKDWGWGGCRGYYHRRG